jgi:endopolyphosphatase
MLYSLEYLLPNKTEDIHPDPFYKIGSNPDRSCHAGKGAAGAFGAEVTECDTPFSLVSATFKWIEQNLKEKIDFVIWTGDSARHDNDDRIPRSDSQVLKLNRYVVHKFVEVFGKTDNIDDPDPTNDFVVPIVPTFGNNDILPHNIFTPGPNKWTRHYLDVWKRFVPQAQKHSFARGGWFFTEVIPNKLAVFSLNTLYFFDSNSAVDGCDLKSEPGYEHMEWLRIQLQFLRVRGMKAILIGHVPPARTESKQSWDESCYQKYTLWMRQYRDIIVTSIFGHMNLDHFMFQDMKELDYGFKIAGIEDYRDSAKIVPARDGDDLLKVSAKSTYLTELRAGWSDLPAPPVNASHFSSDWEHVIGVAKDVSDDNDMRKFLKDIGGQYAERFSLSMVSPSVVPNFFPTLRVIDYNIDGLEHHHPAEGVIGDPAEELILADRNGLEGDEVYEARVEANIGELDIEPEKRRKGKKSKKRRRKHKKPNFAVPKPPSKSSPPGPGYSPQPLSILSFTQYYANLTRIHEQIAADEKSKHDPEVHFKYEIEYTTNDDKYYQMKDLTVRSMLQLAERIGRDELKMHDEVLEEQHLDIWKDKKKKTAKNRLWKEFIKRAFVHTKPDEDIDQDFG